MCQKILLALSLGLTALLGAGVRDRRLNFLPPYPYGLVLITPPQQGRFADAGASRGKLVDHLHPLYRNILSEYVTDGRNYLSADGTRVCAADQCYKQVEGDIQSGAKQLPLTVAGDVAWVCAQTAERTNSIVTVGRPGIPRGHWRNGRRPAQRGRHTCSVVQRIRSPGHRSFIQSQRRTRRSEPST